MRFRLIWSLTLLLSLAIGVFACSAVEADATKAYPPIYTGMAMHSTEIERLLAIARNWPSIAPFWTRAALSTACSIRVLGIAACTSSGYVSALKLDRTREITSLPILESFETLAYLESFESSLPFTQLPPASWMSRLRRLQSISMVGTRITGGPLPWTNLKLTSLHSFELEFSPIGDVFHYPASAIPGWFENLDHLKLSFVNFGAMASFAPIIQKVITFNLTECGWDYLLPSSSAPNYRLKTLSINAPLSRSGASSKPLTARVATMHTFFALNIVELLNVPTIGIFPTFPKTLRSLTVRNLNNLVGGAPDLALLGSSSLMQNFEISRCPRLTGNLPMPDQPDSSQLESFIVRDTGFTTGYLTGNLFKLLKLKTVIISGLERMAPAAIPCPELYQTCSIKTLVLSSIQLKGEIPSWIGKRCSSLERIDFSYNQLTGEIPSAWTTNSLLEFTMASNRLSGTLPPALSWSSNAVAASSFARGNTILNVRNNLLTGQIPDSYFNTKFEDFDVSNNRLSLCLNSAEIGQKAHSSLNSGACALGSQGTSWCSCTNIWPFSCNPAQTCM